MLGTSLPPSARSGLLPLAATALALSHAHLVQPAPLAAQTGDAVAPGTHFLHADRFELEDGSYAVAERGLLFVPQDRSRPEAGTVGIVFHRFPVQRSAGRDSPPIFILHGGPGFGGLELEDPGYFEENIEPYTAFTDVVVVGQRGFGPSMPDTECEGVRTSIFDPTAAESERAEALREAIRKCRGFWEGEGLVLEGFNVREAASDVADVAGALGYDRITLWGVSFGSHWAMAILRDHPELVARALIGGTEGPNHTYDSPTGILNVLRRVAAEAETAPELEPWIPQDGFVETLRETIRRAERDPPVVTVEDSTSGETREVTVRARMLRAIADGYSSVPDSVHEMAAWPADVLRLYAGRFEEISRRALPPDRGEWSRIPDASFWLLDCASGITDERADELFRDPAREVVGPTAWFYRVGCPAWGVDLGDEFRTSFETAVPTLVVHGDWDLSTPYENALEIMPSFTEGKLVRVERGTHGALDEAMEASESFRADVVRFLRTGRMDGIPERVELPPVNWIVPSDLPLPGAREGEDP